MKKSRLLGMGCALGVLVALCQPLLAGTVVREIDADTLLVTRYQGKPPHARFTIDRNTDAELFALYQSRIGVTPLPVFAVTGRGAPGKSLPGSRMRVSSDIVELTEIARLEEVESDSNDTRRWIGAPGKNIRTGR